MHQIEIPKEASFTPIYSPRTSLYRYGDQIDKLTTNLAINIDKYILGFFKDTFEANENEIGLNQFMDVGQKFLKSWQRELKDRSYKIRQCLFRLFDEANLHKKETICWADFNAMLIEKGLNLKSLRNQQSGNTSMMKHINVPYYSKHTTPIQKIVSLNNKIAFFHEQSCAVQFLPLQQSSQPPKPLVLTQQQLKVETTISKRSKQGKKQYHKKDLVVANYKNVILDMIYIKDNKYNMLITSSSDYMVRGWDVSSNVPTLAKQPENQDQRMIHQFTQQIYRTSWDHINQILYCSGKTTKVFEWMVKTDSERELYDLQRGHKENISAMLIMPKLQFLATGDEAGKLILWDTISQSIKFKYEEHKRSIIDMTFHEGLILLFTSAYDHSICVWNPYIQSLIHKVISNVNCLQIDIIPDTNYLIALDAASNVKIRQVNKFTMVSQFTVNKPEQKIEPTTIAATKEPLRYYFGGTTLQCYEMVHNDVNLMMDSSVVDMKYISSRFQLFVAIRNNVVTFNLLTGQMTNLLAKLTNGEITAFDIIEQLGWMVVGDSQGNVVIRKIENGIQIKHLHKFKTNVTNILTSFETADKTVFASSFQGEIAIFIKDNSNDYVLQRMINIKKINPNCNLSCLSFEPKRNMLIMGTNLGEIIFLDVDKNKIVSKCMLKSGDVYGFLQLTQISVLLCFTRKAQILGLYLPPHLKKFKAACHLVSDQNSAKINCLIMSRTSKRCYIGSENGELMCFWLNEAAIMPNTSEEPNIIKHIWKTSHTEPIRNLIFVENQQSMVVTVGTNKLLVVECREGQVQAELNFNNRKIDEPEPILYLNEDTNQIYIKELDQFVDVGEDNVVRRIADPNYYLDIVQKRYKIGGISNKNWPLIPNTEPQVTSISNLLNKLGGIIAQNQKKPKKQSKLKKSPSAHASLSKAVELKERWDRQKEQEEVANLNRSNISRGELSNSKYNTLYKKMKVGKMNSLHSKSSGKFGTNEKYVDVNNPLYKLGIALRNVNEKDENALKLIQIAEGQMAKKMALKLPRLT